MFCFSVAAGMDAAKGTSKGMQPLSGDEARLPVRWAQRRAHIYLTLPVREPKDVTTTVTNSGSSFCLTCCDAEHGSCMSCIDFWGPIKPHYIGPKVTATMIRVVFEKQRAVEWPRLAAGQGKDPTVTYDWDLDGSLVSDSETDEWEEDEAEGGEEGSASESQAPATDVHDEGFPEFYPVDDVRAEAVLREMREVPLCEPRRIAAIEDFVVSLGHWKPLDIVQIIAVTLMAMLFGAAFMLVAVRLRLVS